MWKDARQVMSILPNLQEVDELMNLDEILNVIERPLEVKELWAILREVCRVLRCIDESSKICQQVILSLETLALDKDGSVFIVKSESEPAAAHRAPEYELVGNSLKSHLYTLGMTILDAAYSNTATYGDQLLSNHLKRVLGAVTTDDYDGRPEVSTIIAECNRALDGQDSKGICRDLARSAIQVQSDQESELRAEKSQLTQTAPAVEIRASGFPTKQNNNNNKYSKKDFSNVFKQRLRTHIQSLSSVGSSTDIEVNDEDTHYAVQILPKSHGNSPILAGNDSKDTSDTNPLQSFSDSVVPELSESVFQDSPQPLQDSVSVDGTCGTFQISGITELDSYSIVVDDSDCDRQKLDLRFVNCDRLTARLNTPRSNVLEVSRGANRYLGDIDQEDEERSSQFDEFSSCDEEELLLLEESLVYDTGESDASDSRMASPNRKVTRGYSAKMPAVTTLRGPGSTGLERTVSMDNGNSLLSAALANSSTLPFSPTNSLSPGLRSSDSENNYETIGRGRASRPLRRDARPLMRSPSFNGDVMSPPRLGSPTRGLIMDVMPRKHTKLKEKSSLQRTNSMKDTVNHLLKKYSFTGKNRPNIAKTSLALKERMAAHRRQKQTAVLVEEGSTRPRIRSSSSGSRERAFHRSASDSSLKTVGSTKVSHSRTSSFEGLCMGDILRRIGTGLPERELWAVCRECVLTVLDIQTAPCISMDTVIMLDSGHVSFISLPDNCDLDPMFLAPEAMTGGGLNEKTIVFSVAALLWLAADYNLSENQEPEFSDTFDELMMSMTHDEPEMRPTLIEVLEKCDAAQSERREPFPQLCRSLLRDAHNAKNYGRSNSLVQELMHEEVEQKKEISRCGLLDEIKIASLTKTLKPASERKLPEKPKELNLHDHVMSGIKHEFSRLKPRSKPVEMSIKEVYANNPKLMQGLKRVTVKANDPNKSQPLEDMLSPGKTSSDSLLSPSKIRADIRAALRLLEQSQRAAASEKVKEIQTYDTSVDEEVPTIDLRVSSSDLPQCVVRENSFAEADQSSSVTSELPETDSESLVDHRSDAITVSSNVAKMSVHLQVSSVDVEPSLSSPPESRIPKPKLFKRRNSDNSSNDSKSYTELPLTKAKSVTSLKTIQKPTVKKVINQNHILARNYPDDELEQAVCDGTMNAAHQPSIRDAQDLVVSPNSGFTVVSPSTAQNSNSGFSVLSPQSGFGSNSTSGFSVVLPQAGAHPNSAVIVSQRSGPMSKPNSGFSVSPLSGAQPNSGFSAVSKSKSANVNAPVPKKRVVPSGGVGTQVNNDTNSKGKVPKAFISPATHFTPIVLEAETGFFKGKENMKQPVITKKEPEKTSGHFKKTDSAANNCKKIVAEKLKMLKKQLAKNQPPLHMVDDLENESSFETGPSGSRSHPNSRVTSPVEAKKCLSPPETELRAAAREVPVPAVRQTLKKKIQQKVTEKPKVPSPRNIVEEKTQASEMVSGNAQNPFLIQPDIDLGTVTHLQDPKTGIVYAMIPVTKPVLPKAEKQPKSGRAVTSGREPQSKDYHDRRTSTSSDEDDYQPRRRRPERKRVIKSESKDKASAKPKQKTPDTKPEPKRRSRSTCKESATVASSEEPNRQVTRGRQSFKSDTSRSRIPLPRERAKSQERLTDISRQRGEKAHYPPVSGITRPEIQRSVSEKDLKSLHLHVYGDIDIGAPIGASTDFDNTEITFSAIDSPRIQPPKNGVSPLEKIVPNLNSSFEEHEAQYRVEEAEIVPQQKEIVHGARAAISPIVPQSPSPPLSKDSGVSGLILKSNGAAAYPSLMDRLLSSDAMRRHEVLRKVVLLIREEFAFDGYMENGVEDLVMAEWLMSLSKLSWETFCLSVSEKYCDFYWSEELLYSLYEAINGQSPFSRLNTNKTEGPMHIGHARVLRTEEPQSSQDSGPSNDACNRPMPASKGYQKPSYVKNKNSRFISDTSDSTDTEAMRTRRRRAKRKNNLDKNKSLSAGNLLLDTVGDVDQSKPVRSMSQENLLNVSPRRKSKLTTSRLKKAQSQGELSMPKSEKPQNVLMDRTDYFMPSDVVIPDSVSDFTDPTPSVPQFRAKMSESETDSTAASQDVTFRFRPVGQAPILRRDSSHEWRKPVRRHRPVRDDSMSSHSSAGGPQRPPSAALTVSSQGSNPMPGSDVPRLNKTSLMCYASEMQGQVHSDIKSMEDQLQLYRARGAVEAKIAEIDQQMMMENKMRQKSQKFHRKMMESGKSSKGGVDQRNILSKVSKEITEMTSKLVFLELARRHLEMLYAEQWGIDISLLSALAHANYQSTLDLQPKPTSLLLQYQSQRSQENKEDLQVLHAGTPTGLTVYLFAKESLSGGYIHEFFYCFRYFTTAKSVLNFIIGRYTIANGDSQQTDNHQRIQRRAIDLLQYWVEGFYSLDFKSDQELLKLLDEFVEDKMSKMDKNTESFLHLLEDCRDGCHEDFSKAFAARTQDTPDLDQVSTDSQPNKKWKQVFGKAKSQKNKVISYSKQKVPEGDVNLPNFSRPGDSFTLIDYSSQRLAEQLTMIEQALYRETHPVMFLNSKAQGIGVASLSGAEIRKSSAAGLPFLHLRCVNVWDGPMENSLFVGNDNLRNCIQRMIEHGHRLTHWVSAEILCCNSAKVQQNILTKFIYTAKMCLDMRNYATAISITDVLENYIVRQLPVWKTLSSKSISIVEDLVQVKSNLKKNDMCLLESPEAKLGPTIPSVLLFLLHVQQLEIGGFTLANGMLKWKKMRSIARVIDQLRIFKDYYYEFESSPDLEDMIQQRMKEYRERDLHTLASQYEINVTKLPSSSKLPDAFRNLKKKFQGKSEN